MFSGPNRWITVWIFVSEKSKKSSGKSNFALCGVLGPLGYSQKLHSLSIKMLNFPSLFILGVARPHFDLCEILLIFSSFRVRPLVALRQWIASCCIGVAEKGRQRWQRRLRDLHQWIADGLWN